MTTNSSNGPHPGNHATDNTSRRAAMRMLGSGGIATALLSAAGFGESEAEASGLPHFLVDWAEALSSANPYEVAALFTHDGIIEDVTFGIMATGRPAVLQHFATFFTAVPDYQVELLRGFKSGNWAVAEVVLSGTQVGDFPGLPATGQFFSVRSASVFQLHGNRIKRESDYYDLFAVLTQLGVTCG